MFARSALTRSALTRSALTRLPTALVAVAALGAGLTVAAGSAQAVLGVPHCTRQLTVSTVVKDEGTVTGLRGARTNYSFTVSTSVRKPAGATACVLASLTAGVATTPGTAGSQDFGAVSSTLSWPAGNSANRTVVVKVVPDASFEPNEAFTVKVTATSATHPTLAIARGLIVNDDAPPIPVCRPGFICHG